MKSSTALLTLAMLLGTGLAIAASPPPAGPRGGRLLETTDPKAEFLLEKDRSVSVAFYDAAMAPVAPAGQSVTVIAVCDGNKTVLTLNRSGDVLVSDGKVPEGNDCAVVVQFRPSADATQQNFRFKLDTSICGGCSRAEYACNCHE